MNDMLVRCVFTAPTNLFPIPHRSWCRQLVTAGNGVGMNVCARSRKGLNGIRSTGFVQISSYCSTESTVAEEVGNASAMQSRVHQTHPSQPTSLSSLNKETIRNEILQYWMVAEAREKKSQSAKQRGARYCCFTYHDAKREYESPTSSWHWLDKELSSNLAGETGAVYIYKGALSALNLRQRVVSSSGDHRLATAQEFCHEHHDTEESHRRFFEMIVPEGKHTKLIPMWKLAGYSLGFLPTMIGGTKALYVTIESVETFVEEHLKEQIAILENKSVTEEQTADCPELLRLLRICCEDEIHHKEEAALKLLGEDVRHDKLSSPTLSSWWVEPWSKVVRVGSSVAAELARKV